MVGVCLFLIIIIMQGSSVGLPHHHNRIIIIVIIWVYLPRHGWRLPLNYHYYHHNFHNYHNRIIIIIISGFTSSWLAFASSQHLESSPAWGRTLPFTLHSSVHSTSKLWKVLKNFNFCTIFLSSAFSLYIQPLKHFKCSLHSAVGLSLKVSSWDDRVLQTCEHPSLPPEAETYFSFDFQMCQVWQVTNLLITDMVNRNSFPDKSLGNSVYSLVVTAPKWNHMLKSALVI